jgi:hypothetical protein
MFRFLYNQQMNTTERWSAIPGYEGLYEASTLGAIRSVDRFINGRIVGHKSKVKGRILTPALVSGYPRVDLSKQGKSRSVFVHLLVLESFVGPRPPMMVCCHADGDKLNNNVRNLRWDTQSANMLDARAHGTIADGERNGNAAVTSEIAAHVFLSKDSQRSIAKRVGLSQRQVLNIKKRRQWVKVTEALPA